MGNAKKREVSMFFRFYCRAYQRMFQGVGYLLPFRQPKLLEGKGSLLKLPSLISKKQIMNVLIVTDQGISSLGLMNGLLEGLREKEINYVIYDKTVPNPTTDNIEEALKLYRDHSCEAIIACGGGSPMDCAKGTGARVARPDKSLAQLKGLLKVRKKLPLLFAIPTTAGTGSETTVAAVITDAKNHEKYEINDIALIPRYAVLDPLLTVGLPGKITSTTGMDALTHAIEAYLGNSNTKETKLMSQKAVSLIFENIRIAYQDGENVDARGKMLKASYYAGVAFTRAYVGYIHSISHAIGGLYQLPHGLVISVVLPYVLEYYGESAHRKLAKLADVVGCGFSTDTNARKADKFIAAIRAMNREMEIPDKITQIQPKDIPALADRAFKEANPLYPVPRILSRWELENIIRRVAR